LKFLSLEVEHGKLEIPGFFADWARPTHQLLRVLLYCFSFIVIFPYLPGSDSPVFQGVSVFLGLLISLGSSSAISNLIAGLVITYMRAFKNGDRVKIGETTGQVLEKNVLVTRLITAKNEEVTIPNANILTSHTINYSTNKDAGLILHTTITIGYDIAWNKVHELLYEAAAKTEFVLQDPKPFVLQTSLDDFYVSYELNVHTQNPEKTPRIYSQIHSNILDAFNAAGVEIMSPHYRANRDGSDITIPK
jgi:small-conductance mechanosensitive channel